MPLYILLSAQRKSVLAEKNKKVRFLVQGFVFLLHLIKIYLSSSKFQSHLSFHTCVVQVIIHRYQIAIRTSSFI